MTGLEIRAALISRLGAVGLGWYFVTLPGKVSITPGVDGVDPWPTLKAILDADPIAGTRLVRAAVGGACLVESLTPSSPVEPASAACKETLQFRQPEQGALW